MFFCLSQTALDNFPNRYQLGSVWLNLDQGWSRVQHGRRDIFFKGYADSQPLAHMIDQVCAGPDHGLTGNFCVIAFDAQSGLIKINHDLWRSFPLYVHEKGVTNLWPSQHQIWADAQLTLDQALVPSLQHRDLVGEQDTASMTWDQALHRVHDRLLSKTRQFVQQQDRPIKVFLTGGVDTLLVYSYLRACAAPIELVWQSHVEFDRFWLQNSGDIKQHWAYKQIHHWTEPCVLASGAPGDEFMLRSPSTCHAWCQWHGVSLQHLLEHEYRDCYHNLYFTMPKHQTVFKTTSDLPRERKDMFAQLCHMVLNDCQHWHLGHTLTWTPLRDLDVFRTLLRLDLDLLLSQIMDSRFSRDLIELNSPGLTACLSDKKNSGNPLRNLVYLQ